MLHTTRSTVPRVLTATGIEEPITFSNNRGWSPLPQHPVGDGSEFQVRIDRCGDSSKLPPLFEQGEKSPQVAGGRAGSNRAMAWGRNQAISVLCRTPMSSVAMQISYFHVPAEMPAAVEPDAAVVIDVLRATTTIAWALHNGAEAVQAFADLDDLKTAAAAWPAEQRLLLGERGGWRVSISAIPQWR